ncbi:Nif3-like dinuclear metal center hexameric protein [Celerinatantimonas diazotrophica]|uniref:GTP cyclohydrolase 1 type 2 homolog n=1 Tax=Celerinatantimonas diazotrophica TaxID=412034 RepID=A0A4R1JAL6_9GAMM|nr:Nif3-like dinuclear metal center hexameric protein [Celerinatantimonas diazotrophica]TCK47695.1 dinuclear metal center YbgI/SA1388 family protein [Celerinatantimonas diazotrophica]CAG9296681.1 GTP cyclohydrolase 1 type 2 [Celerinatantimonas diazotrophica]
MDPFRLQNILNEELRTFAIKDYCPNGLQVQGRSEIKKIVTGVTASQALIDAAIEREADAVLVHHGYFWKGESPVLTHMKGQRIAALMKHQINLLAYHLPLDIHPTLGNNAQLAALLGIELRRGLEPWDKNSVAMVGELTQPIKGEQLAERIEHVLGRRPLHIQGHQHEIKKIGLCTGGGQSFLSLAAEQGVDAFISGEISEQTTHIAREMEVDFFAAGHHATERYGVKALGEWLSEKYQLEVCFVDIDNPV